MPAAAVTPIKKLKKFLPLLKSKIYLTVVSNYQILLLNKVKVLNFKKFPLRRGFLKIYNFRPQTPKKEKKTQSKKKCLF